MILRFDNTQFSKYDGIKKWENTEQKFSTKISSSKKNNVGLSSLIATIFAFILCAVFIRLPFFEEENYGREINAIVDTLEVVVDNFYNGKSK